MLKGFDTTWARLKKEIDMAAGRVSETIRVPEILTDEEMVQYQLTSYTMKNFTVNRIWNDSKIRNQGFETKYSLRESVEEAAKDLMSRR